MTVDEGTRTVTVTPGRAAQELDLRGDEFRLAVQLGLVRTVPAGEGGRRRVERCEVDRLRAAPDFPAGLRERVRAVGTAEAAALLEITPERFIRLARTGHVSPVRFSLNRYRAVVWTYLAEEVAEFGLTCPALLTGRLPLELRERLAAHEDLRPRNWRARRLGALLRATDDPWVQAAAMASMLDPVQVAEVVDDPYERAHLDRLRPPAPPGMPVRAAARDIAERLTRADDPDEILWHRLSLALALDEARTEQPAPYPGGPGRSGASGGRPGAGLPVGVFRQPAPTVARVLPPPPVLPPLPVLPMPPALAVPPLPSESPVPPPPSAEPVVPVAVPSPVPASVPAPAQVPAPAGRPAGVERPPSRPAARARLLDRLRRRRAADGRRAGGRRRPVSWP
ncbi:DUF6397 family protein [Streptomyces sp. TX20-6-3]|uniref:DUF6397 family protein n=1 Tax=Streptomyces sp. TX20-6-3 TaxID=3028705 RepID=UPI0029BD73F1|nr:DUF6397 family protein [Streptomyces sp. TX20-6-3]MDX2563043.1 DUF6397 family protein [Streptomyces sp. TX20-6-3]